MYKQHYRISKSQDQSLTNQFHIFFVFFSSKIVTIPIKSGQLAGMKFEYKKNANKMLE